NNGPSNAQSVALTDAVPTNTTFVSATTPAGWTRTDSTAVGGAGTLSFTIATLTPGASATFTFVDTVNINAPVGSAISNTATAGSDTSDSLPGNNTKTVFTTVASNLKITQQGPSLVGLGATYTITVTITNAGSTTA